MGGTNHESNLIKLTIPEHAAWHYELWVYYGKIEDWIAWKMLSGQGNNPEVWLAKSKLGGEAARKKLKGLYKPTPGLDEWRKHNSSWNKGKFHSEKIKKKISLAKKGQGKGIKQSPELIAKRTKNQKGKIVSNETKEKLRIAALNYGGININTPFGEFNSINQAVSIIGVCGHTIKKRCLSDNFPEWYIRPFYANQPILVALKP